jgi:hypothetical protein
MSGVVGPQSLLAAVDAANDGDSTATMSPGTAFRGRAGVSCTLASARALDAREPLSEEGAQEVRLLVR